MPDITKGVQTVLFCDVHRNRPRSYMHRHKLHVKSAGWNAWGNIEGKEIIKGMNLMVKGKKGGEKKYSVSIYTQHGTINQVCIISCIGLLVMDLYLQ